MTSRSIGDKVTDSGGRSETSSALMNQPIVMDVGTSTTKAGFAGGAKPKVRQCRIPITYDTVV